MLIELLSNVQSFYSCEFWCKTWKWIFQRTMTKVKNWHSWNRFSTMNQKLVTFPWMTKDFQAWFQFKKQFPMKINEPIASSESCFSRYIFFINFCLKYVIAIGKPKFLMNGMNESLFGFFFDILQLACWLCCFSPNDLQHWIRLNEGQPTTNEKKWCNILKNIKFLDKQTNESKM